MNAEAKDKPIRELLLDISHTMNSTSSDQEPGVVNPKRLNRVCFVASLVALVFVAGVLIAMIWQFIDSGRGLQCIGSVAVVLFALLSFRAVNGTFVD
jgi:hypothetical protein